MDRARAAQLLLREFDSRYPNACSSANTALNALAGTARQVDCTDPAARQRAKEDWARAGLTAPR